MKTRSHLFCLKLSNKNILFDIFKTIPVLRTFCWWHILSIVKVEVQNDGAVFSLNVLHLGSLQTPQVPTPLIIL